MLKRQEKINPVSFIFPLLVIGILVTAFLARDTVFGVFKSAEGLRDAVRAAGGWAPLAFVALQALQVIVFILPGEIAQVAGGWLFGIPGGVSLTLAGIALGSAADFLLARLLGTRFVAGLFGREALQRFDLIRTSPKIELSFFALFLIPGIPKDILCFAAGLSAMRLRTFLAVSLMGRLPGIVGSTIMGAAAAQGQRGLFWGVLAASVILFAIGLLFRNVIVQIIVNRRKNR